MRLDQIAIQLWTLRDLVAADLFGTLHRLAKLGYAGIEFAGFAGCEPASIRSVLDADGLAAAGCHVSFESLVEDPVTALDAVEAIGCPRVVVPGVPAAWRTTQGWVDTSVSHLARIAERCAARGLRLAYHNHDFEFAALDGPPMWARLAEALPPDVELELDVYWAAYAGHDAASLIASDRRIRLLHMKDMGPGPGRNDLPPGDGTLLWQPIVDAADAQVEWFIVEQDNPIDPFDSASRGLAFLRTLTTDAAMVAPVR